MQTINIDIHNSFSSLLKSQIDNNYNTTILPILRNIKKQSVIHYNLAIKEERQQYFIEYMNRINNLLLAFNSYLAKDYWKKNSENIKIDTKNNYIQMLEPGNPLNKIEYLLSFYLEDKKDYEHYFNKFYIWENLFRHQLCHGWFNFFILLHMLQKDTQIKFIDKQYVNSIKEEIEKINKNLEEIKKEYNSLNKNVRKNYKNKYIEDTEKLEERNKFLKSQEKNTVKEIVKLTKLIPNLEELRKQYKKSILTNPLLCDVVLIDITNLNNRYNKKGVKYLLDPSFVEEICFNFELTKNEIQEYNKEKLEDTLIIKFLKEIEKNGKICFSLNNLIEDIQNIINTTN